MWGSRRRCFRSGLLWGVAPVRKVGPCAYLLPRWPGGLAELHAAGAGSWHLGPAPVPPGAFLQAFAAGAGRPYATSASATPPHLERLKRSIEYEGSSGYCNARGRVTFAEVLVRGA